MSKRCPMCAENGRDSKGDHLYLMEDGETWCCNRAEYHTSGDPYYLFKDSKETITEEVPRVAFESVEDIQSLSQGIMLRDIKPDILSRYGVYAEVGGDGTPIKHYYPIHGKSGLLGYEVRIVEPKGFYKTCKVASGEALLGGQNVVPLKPEHLVITEGFLDMMTMQQTLKRAGLKSAYVVSLQNGANLSSLRDNIDFLKSALNVYIYPDQDEPGQKIVQEVALLIPSIKILKTSEKDACDMIKEGKATELVDAFHKAQRYKPSSIVSAVDAKAEALKPIEWGMSYPFKSLTNITYGIRTKRLIGIASAPGGGKTQLCKAIQHHLIKEHEEKVGLFALEESPGEALRELAGYIMNKPLDKPDCVYDPKELERVLDSLEEKVVLYNVDNYDGNWVDIEEAIRWMVSDGVKYIFIDPITVLTTHLSSSETNLYLNEAMFNLSRLVKSSDCTIYYTAHLNNSKTGRDASEGGKILASQMTGSKAMWRFSTDVWGARRDQYAEEVIERNTTIIESIKYRKPSKPGKFELLYDESTGTLSETETPF